MSIYGGAQGGYGGNQLGHSNSTRRPQSTQIYGAPQQRQQGGYGGGGGYGQPGAPPGADPQLWQWVRTLADLSHNVADMPATIVSSVLWMQISLDPLR